MVRLPTAGPGSPCRLLAAVSRLRHVLLLPAEPEARSEPAAVLGGVSGTELTQRSAVLLHTDQERQGEQPYLLRASVGGADGLMLRGAGAGGGSRSSNEAPRGFPILFPGCVLQALSTGRGKSCTPRRHGQIQEQRNLRAVSIGEGSRRAGKEAGSGMCRGRSPHQEAP